MPANEPSPRPWLDERATGVYVIAVTPFTDEGAVDFASIDSLVAFYEAAGVDGITVLGQLGEAPKLTQAESRAVVERVLSRTTLPVVVGVSAPGLAPMKELADAVMDAGAAGVMVAPPASVRTDDQALRFFSEVGSTLGEVPFALQDYPLTTSVMLSPAVISRIVAEVPTCVMLKHEDWPGLNKITAIRAAEAKGARRISILCGNGGLFLPEELERGADGAMTGFGFPEMMVAMVREHRPGNGERMRDIFDAYLPLVRYEQQLGLGLACRKYVLQKRGAIRSAALRQPGPKLSPADILDIEWLLARQTARLTELGVETKLLASP